MEKVPFVKMCSFARIPSKRRTDDAGYDLFAANTQIILPYGREAIDTGIALTVPMNTYGRIAPTSNLSYHSWLNVGGGVIDRGYTGSIKVILFNHSSKPKIIYRGDKIAQLIFEVIRAIELVEVSGLKESERGHAGLNLRGTCASTST